MLLSPNYTAGQVISRQDSSGLYTARPGAMSATYAANGLNQYSGVTGASASYSGANAATLSYDPLGRLQSETSSSGTTYFLYDGSALVGEYGPSGTILNRYVEGPGTDEPLTWYSGAGMSSRAWYAQDQQGSVIQTADQSGNAGATTYDYGPYGEPVTGSGASAWGGSRYRYTGQIEIPGAQVYFYKARVYDPAVGRFYQTDPVGNVSDVNLYAYAGQDPINGSDTTGQVTFIDACTTILVPGPTVSDDGVTTVRELAGPFCSPILGLSSIDFSAVVNLPQLPRLSKTVSSQNNQKTCPSSGGLRAPDFGSVSGSLPILNPITGPSLGVGVAFTADRYGNDYFSLNGVAGFPTAAGASLMGGWMNGRMPSAAQLGGMLSSWGAGVTGGYIAGGGFYGNQSGTATSAGLTTPGVSAYAGYTWKLPTHTPGWCN